MAKLQGVEIIDMQNGEVTKFKSDGVTYRKVDRKARVGDAVIFTDGALDSITHRYITAGKKYKVTRIDRCGDPLFTDDEWDDIPVYTLSRTQGAVLVYEKVAESETSETAWKKGDKVRHKCKGNVVEVYAYKPTHRTYGESAGWEFIDHKKGFTYIDDDNFEYWDEIGDYEKVAEYETQATELYALVTTMSGETFREPIESREEIESLTRSLEFGGLIHLRNLNVYVAPHNVATIKAQEIAG